MKIKFFITPVYPYGDDHYYHEMIALAEGFLSLGHEVYGNADYWWQPEKKAFLIKGDNANNSFDIAVYDYRYVTSFAHLLFRKGYPNFDKSKIHILIDRNDWNQPVWWNNPQYHIFNFIFAGNIYSTIKYPHNIRPWAIGLTEKIISYTDLFYNENESRENITGYNFRVEHNMRSFILNNLKIELKKYPVSERFTNADFENETDEFYYHASTKRLNPAYYKVLCRTRFFLAFGGYYDFKPLKYQPYSFSDKLIRKPAYWKYLNLKKKRKDFSDAVFIFQHDNFRFWETLYSGAIAINLHLEHWNFKLPVMPQPDEHYIGITTIDAKNVEDKISRMNENEIKTMSDKAREWVFKNYSPRAQAQRILSEIG